MYRDFVIIGLLAAIIASQWLIYKLRSMDANEVVGQLITITESLGPSTNGDYLSDMADSLSEIERTLHDVRNDVEKSLG